MTVEHGTSFDLGSALESAGVVAVVQLPDPSIAIPLADALAAGGVTAIEITFRAAGAAEAIAAIRAARPQLTVGAGTVITLEQAGAALAAGAQFVVAPGTNPRVMERVLAGGAAMLPGVATPSEIEANLERGITTMKFFPAEALGGVAYLRSVYGPFRQVRFVPSGGVTAALLPEYLAQPNVAAVGGTWLAPVKVLEAGDLGQVERNAREASAAVRQARGR